ncbi:efflux RND transporter periplasmic adaptor subunit [Sedimenticola sp.]|uniref:efflux RND transporter periplasmic adaptor subunit n=1 Tax=Sedimenticola sp. TaxID=1940285 RepID=UPI003D100E00
MRTLSPKQIIRAGLLLLPSTVVLAAAPPGGMPPMPVEAQPVTVGEIVRSADTVGNLLGYEAVVLRPQIQGKVEKILFEEGQPVTAGQPMVQLDDDQYRAELDEAVANRDLSDANYRRTQELIKRKVASQTDKDKAYAELQANKARVALKKEALSKTVLAAPFDGIAGLRAVSVGDVVTPGQALVEVVDIDPIKVDFRVPEKYVGEVQQGQQIKIRVDAFPGEKFIGEVYAVAPLIDSNGRNLQMRATVPNADSRLRPGMFARVELAMKRYENAISVPEEAIVPMGDKQLVYRIKDGKAEMVPVKLGIRHQAMVQVVQGLEPGDVVITAGQIKVRPGAPVNPINLKQDNAEAPL